MSDGVVIVGDLLTPDEGRSFPVLLNMTPYGPATYFNTYTSEGYAHVNVDIRGTGRSGGQLCLFCEREQQDVYDVVEWIADQDWSNGNVGMYGGSYQGITPLIGASLQPPHLKAIVPAVVLADAYRDIVWHNGIFNLNFVAQWTPLQFGLGMTGTASDERSRREAEPATRGRESAHPVGRALLQGALDLHEVRQDQGADAPAGRVVRRLLARHDPRLPGHSEQVQATRHGAVHAQGLRAPFDPGQRIRGQRRTTGSRTRYSAWMDHFLKGKDNDVENGPPVLYYDLGASKWAESAPWPPSDSRLETFYLSGDASGVAVSRTTVRS